MAFAAVALGWLLAALLLMAAAERYIPDHVWDKLERFLGFSKEVKKDG